MTTNQVNIGEVIAHGLAFDPKNCEALRTMDLNSVLRSVSRLFELLDERNIDYVLVGGIAMLVYVEGRNTQDVDIILSSDSLKSLPEIDIQDRKGEFVRGRFGDLQVDLLLTDNALFDIVRREHTTLQQFVQQPVPCATPTGLLLLKLFALPSLYRQGEFDRSELYERDITMLMRKFQPEVEPIFTALAEHLLESDLRELQSIVSEIQTRLDRAERRFRNG